MALHWPTFFTRLGSAIVFSAIMMAGFLWNAWAFAVLILLIMLLCLREFFKLIRKIYNPENPAGGTGFSVLLSSVMFFFSTFMYLFFPENILLFKLSFVAGIIILSIGFLGSLLQKNQAFSIFALYGSSLFYITSTALMLLYLRHLSLCIPLALILMIWMNDTMAYLVGSFIGKTPFSKISPKKTWEGTAGGAILTIVGAAAWGYYSPYYKMQDWIVLALCASVAGTAGDLLESKLKRLAEVKDSGMIMPGHGGALDRFDSLLIATPFAFAYAYMFMPQISMVIF